MEICKKPESHFRQKTAPHKQRKNTATTWKCFQNKMALILGARREVHCAGPRGSAEVSDRTSNNEANHFRKKTAPHEI